MANSLEVKDPEIVLATSGESFHWAKRFLGKKMGYDAARLYSFCRVLDDIADEKTDLDTKIKRFEGMRNFLKKSYDACLLYTSPSPRDAHESRMPSSA